MLRVGFGMRLISDSVLDEPYRSAAAFNTLRRYVKFTEKEVRAVILFYGGAGKRGCILVKNE